MKPLETPACGEDLSLLVGGCSGTVVLERNLDQPLLLLFKIFFKLIFREREREGERERNITVWMPLQRPLLGTWPTTQACVLTGN